MLRSFFLALTISSLLAGCDRAQQAPAKAQRIVLGDAGPGDKPLDSPDTTGAEWTVAANGQSIDFGKPGSKPWLSLACQVRAKPPTMRIIRHVTVRPGQKALFPVLGNGTISRFKVDARLADGEWRWEGEVPADDALLEVFTGPREIEATLPGAGSLMIAGSRLPGQFVDWCRKGGDVERPVEAEALEATGGVEG
ncbi:hypothetical protein [Tsuneonella sp. HG222]